MTKNELMALLRREYVDRNASKCKADVNAFTALEGERVDVVVKFDDGKVGVIELPSDEAFCLVDVKKDALARTKKTPLTDEQTDERVLAWAREKLFKSSEKIAEMRAKKEAINSRPSRSLSAVNS